MASIEFLGTNKTHALFDIVGVPSNYSGKYVTWHVYESTSEESYVEKTTFPIQSGQTTYRASVQLTDGKSYKYTEAWISSSSTPQSSADCDEILTWDVGVFSINKDRYLSVDSGVGNEVTVTVYGMSSSYSHKERTIRFLPNKSSSNVLTSQPITMENGFTKYSFTIELEEDQTYDLMQAEILYYTDSDNTEFDFVYLATTCNISTEEGAISAPTIDKFLVSQAEEGSKTLLCTFKISNAFKWTETSTKSLWTEINIYVGSTLMWSIDPETIDDTVINGQCEITVDDYGYFEIRLEAWNTRYLYSQGAVSSPSVFKSCGINVIGLRPNCTLNCVWSTKNIIDEYGNELVCNNYPHITAANWEQFCEDINTVRELKQSSSSYDFTPVQQGSPISASLWNELVDAICSIDGSDTTLYIANRKQEITPKWISSLEGKLRSLCDLYY